VSGSWAIYSVIAYFFTIILTVFNIQDVDGGWF
jgi:hypothetical protein